MDGITGLVGREETWDVDVVVEVNATEPNNFTVSSNWGLGRDGGQTSTCRWL